MTTNPEAAAIARCETCRWWRKDGGRLWAGDCHGAPPSAAFSPVTGDPVTFWPVTAGDDWCGEYQPHLEGQPT